LVGAAANSAVTPANRRVAAGRPSLLGVAYDPVTFAEAMAVIEQACITRVPVRVSTVNLNFATLAHREPSFATLVATTGLSVVDGRILQWLTWLAGEPAPEQITGHDLFRACVGMAERDGLSFFLLGGEPGVASALAGRLVADHGLRAVGTHHGSFTRDGHSEQEDVLLARIRDAAPDLLFVALGAPKQEAWLANHQAALGVPVGVGVGCVFDVETGRIARAPRWMQRAGLESFFQLVVAPRRYLERYVLDDVPTLGRALVAALRLRATTWLHGHR
jgi:N-acetylglucosaminyldiphosphoundecaprenol N-acetyl-beta-D-mannosaminyltransferase